MENVLQLLDATHQLNKKMASTQVFSLYLIVLLKVVLGDEYPLYAPKKEYFPPATSYGVPIQSVEGPVTTSFTYNIPLEVSPSHDAIPEHVVQPALVYGVPETPKPIYGIPIVPAPKPTPIKVVYDVPATVKPTISHVYGVPIIPAPKPKPIKVVYDVPVVEAPKPKPILPVYGVPAPKPKPIKVVYDVPVETPKPQPIQHVYGVPALKPIAPSRVYDVPKPHTQYGLPEQIIHIPRLNAPYP